MTEAKPNLVQIEFFHKQLSRPKTVFRLYDTEGILSAYVQRREALVAKRDAAVRHYDAATGPISSMWRLWKFARAHRALGSYVLDHEYRVEMSRNAVFGTLRSKKGDVAIETKEHRFRIACTDEHEDDILRISSNVTIDGVWIFVFEHAPILSDDVRIIAKVL